MTRTARRHLGIGTWMVLVSLSAALPMLGLLLGLTWVRLEERQARQFDRLQRQAEVLAAAVDALLQRDLSMLRTMALSPAAQQGHWDLLAAFAERTVAADPQLAGIGVVTPGGVPRVRTTASPVAAAPFQAALAARTELWRDGLPWVMPLRIGTLPDAHAIDIAVPLRDPQGAVTHALVASVRTTALDAVLQAMPLPAEGIAGVLDPRRVIAARSHDAQRWVGQPATPSLQTLLARGPGEIGISDTRDGRRVYTAVAAVGATGWHVALGVPVDALQAERSRELGLVLVLGVPLTLVGMALSFALGRRLASQVRSAARGEASGRTGVHEVAQLSARVDAARRDPLTGLASRSGWLEQVGRQHARGQVGAVLFLDLDGFKAINDGQGHDAGDRALQAVAGVLTASLRPGDVAGRLGGDEFVVAVQVDDADMPRAAQAVAQRIVDAVAALGQGLGCSVGVALLHPGERLPSGLERADQAMLRAKQAGKNRVESDVDDAAAGRP
ncbi:MAG: GGDEF domain-containing protein [Burkholderiaceae bacterium]|nr:GGDEF domain-containing protein [Rhodoferax sp.]MCP5287260.1 GGDEF domain-containing protein [Burkholderiaceae bacterium]